MKEPSTLWGPVYRLDQWNSLRMQLLWVYERDIAGTTNTAGSEHDYHSALRIRRGWAEAGRSRASALHAEAGDWLILQQGQRWQRFSDPCIVTSIGFRIQVPAGDPLFDKGLPLHLPKGSAPKLDAAAKNLMATAGRTAGLGFSPIDRPVSLDQFMDWQDAFRAFLRTISSEFLNRGVSSRGMDSEHPAVERALDFIAHSGRRVPGHEIASHAGVSAVHLDRLMVAATGHTVHGFVEQHRLRMARDLLRDESASLKSIAYQLGFSSPPHFHTWFRKHCGSTPAKYRASHAH